MDATNHAGLSLLPGAAPLDMANLSREVIVIPNLDTGDTERTYAPEHEHTAWGQDHTQAWYEERLLTHRDLADITDLEATRRRYLDERGASEPALSLMALVARATVIALGSYPRCHGRAAGWAGASMQRRGCHLGIVVATERGQVVPVLRDAERKTTRELAMALEEAEACAHRGTPADMAMGHSTFVLADMDHAGLGSNVDDAQAMLGPAAGAVLGLGRARIHPVEWEGAFLERLYLPLSLTYACRRISEADAVGFTRAVAELLANPLRLLMAC